MPLRSGSGHNGGMATQRKLTARQQRFVEEFLLDGNATAAYIRAGYAARGNAAESAACRLLRNVQVSAAIAAAQAARSARTQITQDWVLERLHAEALFTGEGASHSARVAALKLAGQHLGMFAERHQHTGAEGGPIVIREIVVDGSTDPAR